MEQLAAAAAAQGSDGRGGTLRRRRGERLGARRARGQRPARALNPSVRAARARRPSGRRARSADADLESRGREREGRPGQEGTVLPGLGKGRGPEAMR